MKHDPNIAGIIIGVLITLGAVIFIIIDQRKNPSRDREIDHEDARKKPRSIDRWED